MFEGHSKGHTIIKATCRDALAILLKGLDHLPKGNTVGSSRFFQAEDGIRDIGVTGVQTCALPIYPRRRGSSDCRTLNV